MLVEREEWLKGGEGKQDAGKREFILHSRLRYTESPVISLMRLGLIPFASIWLIISCSLSFFPFSFPAFIPS